METKDIFGNPLQVGDRVAYVTPKYHELKIGVIAKLTPCGVTLYNRLNRANYQVVKEVTNGD